MQSFFKTVYRLDEANDIQGLLEFVQRPQTDYNEIYYALCWFLSGKRLRPAYILAMLLANHGIVNYNIAVALAFGGVQFNNPFEQERGLAWLREHAGNQPDEQRLPHFDHVVFPVLEPMLQEARAVGNQERLEQLFALLTTALPHLAERFSRSASAEWSPDRVGMQEGESRFPGLDRPELPASLPTARRVMVLTRSHLYPKWLWPDYPWENHWSRMEPHLVAEWRLVTALQAYGWSVERCLLPSLDATLDGRALLAACLHQQTDILFIDERLVWRGQQESETRRIMSEMLAILKQVMPEIKVVMTLLDAQAVDATSLLEVAPLLDGIWGTPSRLHWSGDHPVLVDKVLALPLPHGGHETPPGQPLDGGLWVDEPLTRYRRVWLEAARSMGMPVHEKPDARLLDPLPPEERYALYRHGLASTPCCLRFAARPGEPGQITDRTFETLLSGALLVQEAPAELDRYFIPGKHYLTFSSLAELQAVAGFIHHHPEQAEEIRRCGHAFACDQYSDSRLIEQLVALLYLPRPVAATLSEPVSPGPLARELVTFEYLSVYHWCQVVAPDELMSRSGNLVCRFDEFKAPQPPLDLGLHLRGAGYEDLFPCTDEQVAAFIYYFDFRTRATAPLTPFVARLEHARIEFPGFGVFLDRHFLLEESYHHKRRIAETVTWFGDATKRRVAHVDLPVSITTGFGIPAQVHPLALEVNYYINSGVDQYIAGPALMVSGPSWANWYHWFVEMLPRIWAIQAIPGLEQIPLICRAPLFSYQQESLLALGIAPERIRLFTGQCLQVETLIFPSPLSPENYATANIAWLKETLLPAFGIDTSIPATELIYLSREKLEGRPSRLLNEDAIIGGLQARGFQVVYPEQMSVKQQLELFNRTRFLIAPFGSGGTNIVFCQPGTIFIELMSALFPQFLNMYYASLNRCHYGCMMSSIGDPEGLEMLVDVDGLMRAVDQALRDAG